MTVQQLSASHDVNSGRCQHGLRGLLETTVFMARYDTVRLMTTGGKRAGATWEKGVMSIRDFFFLSWSLCFYFAGVA
jgi:hypothetical protein